MSRRPSILTAVIAAALLLLGALPAGASPRVPSWAADASAGIAPEAKAATERAFSITRKDGNDVRGPLDLASMKISRGKTKDTVAFTGRGPISNGDLDINDGNLLILIDTNDAPPFEYGQYVFYAGGKLRGVLVNLGTNNIVDRTVPTSRTGPRGFRQVIQRAKIHSPGTYRFIAGSYYQGSPCSEAHACIDTIPNRYPPLIPLDHRAPSFGWDDWETYSGDASDELTSPIEFHVADDQFGTGVKEWIVQRQRPRGWPHLDNGGGRARRLTPTVDRAGRRGSDLRPADDRDRPAERTGRSRPPSAPRSRSTTTTATYDPAVTQDVAATGWFLGTRSGISNAVRRAPRPSSFTGGTGTQVCVMGGPVDSGTATADVSLDGAAQLPMTEDVSVLVHSRIQCYADGQRQPAHACSSTGTSASTFWIDGFYVVP